MKIGAMTSSFNTNFKDAVKTAASLGVDGIQSYGTGGYELDAFKSSETYVNEIKDIVSSNGLVFSAICGDFLKGFADKEKNPELIDKSKKVIYFAKQLGCNIVTTHIGQISENETETKKIMREACNILGTYADSIGSFFALETGTETAQILKDFLDSLDCNGIKVNFDPANLVMCSGDKADVDVPILKDYIIHTHAKDGLKLDGDKTHVTDVLDKNKAWDDAEKMRSAGFEFLELPLGCGDVDFDKYLPSLKNAGYDGFLTIEREVGPDPRADIEMAVGFLKEKLANM